MYTEIRMITEGRYPCLELNVPLLAWNEWMQDNVSLLPAEGNENHEIILFSFHNGTVLARCRADHEQMKLLFSSECINLASVSIGEKPLVETTISKFEPFDQTGRFYEGIYLQTSGDHEKAIMAYEKAIKANPKLFRAYNLAGLCSRLTGQNDKAENFYLKSININPTGPEALTNLGTLYLKTGREKEAESLFLRALDNDEFYLNALLKLSRIYLNSRNFLDTDFFTTNLKMFKLYFAFPKVISRLEETAGLGNISLNEYCQRLGASNSLYNSDLIIRQMKTIENYLNNGAVIAAINGIKRLIADGTQTFHDQQIIGWCRQRLEKIKKISDQLKSLDVYNAVSALLVAAPVLKSGVGGTSPLGPIEFFSLVILEIMRDGQIDLHEKKIVQRLKEMLGIKDSDYHQIINRIRLQVSANPFFEKEPKGFQPVRLFRSLAKAAARDKVIEEEEKKILVFASKAFGISSEDVNRIIAEVTA
ncbi:MAG: tetratricopeptide repeat protein [Candidatus Rifleibacteriota bacterium]